MKLSDPLSLPEARKIAVRLYVEMTRLGWREKWTSHTASNIAKLITITWDKLDTADEGRWNLFHNIMIAYLSVSTESKKLIRVPENQEDGLDV